MRTYDEVKAELREMAALLDMYPESVQPKVFDVLMASFMGAEDAAPQTGPRARLGAPPQAGEASGAGPRRKRAPLGSLPSLVKDLDLSGGNNIPPFRQFHDEKNPASHVEFNAVAVYYLEKVMGITGITEDHVFTCHNWIGRRLPDSFRQSLRDAARSSKAYIDTANMADLKMLPRGINLVVQDLPRESSKKVQKAKKKQQS